MKFKSFTTALALAFLMTAGAAFAAPSVENGKKEIVFREAVNESLIASAKEHMKKSDGGIRFKLHRIADADLAAFVTAFPGAQRLDISGKGALTSLSPLTAMANLKELRIDAKNIKDLASLSALSHLEILTIKNAGDLGSLAGLAGLVRLSVESGNDVSNFAAIGQLSNLTRLRLSRINTHSGEAVDLAFLAKLSRLEELTLRECTGVTPDFSGLLAVKRINALKMNRHGAVPPLDLATLKGLPALASLNLADSAVSNFEALAGLPKLTHMRLDGTNGLHSLAPLKDMRALRHVSVSRNAFTDAQLAALPKQIDVKQK